MKEFFQFYKKDYINPDFKLMNADSVDLLDIRIEDFYMNMWRSLFLGNVPYDEKELFC